MGGTGGRALIRPQGVAIIVGPRHDPVNPSKEDTMPRLMRNLNADNSTKVSYTVDASVGLGG